MGILKIHKSIYQQPDLMKLMENYFDEMIELTPDEPETRRFDVCTRAIPEGNCGMVSVDIQMDKSGRPVMGLVSIS